MKENIRFGSKQIDIHLIFSNRKTRGITVMSDLSVKVIAPVDTSSE